MSLVHRARQPDCRSRPWNRSAPGSGAARHCSRAGRARGPEFLPPAQRRDAVVDPGDLPDSEKRASSGFRSHRPHRPDQPVDGFGSPALRRPLHGPAAAAFFARRRNELHARRPGPALIRRQPGAGSRRRGAGRHRFVRVPPGSFTHSAHRLWRTARLRPIALSGRRQRRQRRWALFWPPSSSSPAGNQPCCGSPCWPCSASLS